MELIGRTFLVTGAGSGIGRATSLLIARLGGKVACVDSDEAGLEATRQLLKNSRTTGPELSVPPKRQRVPVPVSRHASVPCALLKNSRKTGSVSRARPEEHASFSTACGRTAVPIPFSNDSHHRFLVHDLRNLDSIHDWLKELALSLGPLHGLVHAAGTSLPLPLRALSTAAWRDMFQINTEAALVLVKEFHARKVYAGENGAVVFISSVMAHVGSPAAAAYSMAKSALEGMARSLAVELAPRGIRVNCVAPGFVETPMFQRLAALQDADYRTRIQALHPLGLGQPEDVANAAAFLLSNAARWITGTVLVVDGGYTAQ